MKLREKKCVLSFYYYYYYYYYYYCYYYYKLVTQHSHLGLDIDGRILWFVTMCKLNRHYNLLQAN